MTLPRPRLSPDDLDEQDARTHFLAIIAAAYDNTRARGRAELLHGAEMFDRKMGGALILFAETKNGTVPEAVYLADRVVIAERLQRFI